MPATPYNRPLATFFYFSTCGLNRPERKALCLSLDFMQFNIFLYYDFKCWIGKHFETGINILYWNFKLFVLATIFAGYFKFSIGKCF